jgi:prevent-host-death family protein
MKPSERIKPISYVKSHVSEIVGSLSETGEPLIITQNGEAKAVLLDYDSYEQSRETFVLLKILALGNKQIDEGRIVPAGQAIRRIRKRRDFSRWSK